MFKETAIATQHRIWHVFQVSKADSIQTFRCPSPLFLDLPLQLKTFNGFVGGKALGVHDGWQKQGCPSIGTQAHIGVYSHRLDHVDWNS